MMSLAADDEGIIDEALVIGTAFCVLFMEDINGLPVFYYVPRDSPRLGWIAWMTNQCSSFLGG